MKEQLEDILDAKFLEMLRTTFRSVSEAKNSGMDIRDVFSLASRWDEWAKENGILEHTPENPEEYIELKSPWKCESKTIYIPKDFAQKILVLGGVP